MTLTLSPPPPPRSATGSEFTDQDAVPATTVWRTFSMMLDPAAFLVAVPMPPTDPPMVALSVIIPPHGDFGTRQLTAHVAARAVRYALGAIRARGPAAVALRLDGVRLDAGGRGGSRLTVMALDRDDPSDVGVADSLLPLSEGTDER
jgi:hypothetical protein